MKSLILTVLLPAMFASALAHADDQAPAQKKPEPSQSELALDHGPRAQVTPAVKRARLQAAKKAAAEQQK